MNEMRQSVDSLIIAQWRQRNWNVSTCLHVHPVLMRKDCLAALENCWRPRDPVCSLRTLQWWHSVILIYLTFHLTTSGQS